LVVHLLVLWLVCCLVRDGFSYSSFTYLMADTLFNSLSSTDYLYLVTGMHALGKVREQLIGFINHV